MLAWVRLQRLAATVQAGVSRVSPPTSTVIAVRVSNPSALYCTTLVFIPSEVEPMRWPKPAVSICSLYNLSPKRKAPTAKTPMEVGTWMDAATRFAPGRAGVTSQAKNAEGPSNQANAPTLLNRTASSRRQRLALPRAAGRAPMRVDTLCPRASVRNIRRSNRAIDPFIGGKFTLRNLLEMKVIAPVLVTVCILISGLAQAQPVDTVDHYPNGAIRAKGQTELGLRQGTWFFYYPSGTLSATESYRSGKLEGQTVYYYPSGVLLGKEQWLNGSLQDSAWYYHSGGSLEKKGIYRDSRYEGLWRHFHASGKLEREVRYENGSPEGAFSLYGENGMLLQDGTYHLGLEHGQWRFFDETGALRYEGEYEDGKRVGVWYTFNRRGQRKVWKYPKE
jgi:antitoxin component YwqK of YwqJK toxin-antitoxin module